MAAMGSVAEGAFSLLMVAGIIGIPISIALVRNHRYALANRYSHMWGWVPGNPDIGKFHGLVEAPPSPYGTPGPRVVREETTAYGKRAWTVAGEPPPRHEPAHISGHDLPTEPAFLSLPPIDVSSDTAGHSSVHAQ